LLTNTSKSNFCSTAFTSCFGKKEVRTYDGEREDEAIHAKVKAASYDKIAVARQVQLNTNSAFAEIKEEVKALFTEEELAENGDLI
jgi:polyribonucleotide nucleotidyltransferase